MDTQHIMEINSGFQKNFFVFNAHNADIDFNFEDAVKINSYN